MQAVWRGAWERMWTRAAHAASTVIASHWRRCAAMAEVERRSEARGVAKRLATRRAASAAAAVVVQSAWRRYAHFVAFYETCLATIFIQQHTRAWLARNRRQCASHQAASRKRRRSHPQSIRAPPRLVVDDDEPDEAE